MSDGNEGAPISDLGALVGLEHGAMYEAELARCFGVPRRNVHVAYLRVYQQGWVSVDKQRPLIWRLTSAGAAYIAKRRQAAAEPGSSSSGTGGRGR